MADNEETFAGGTGDHNKSLHQTPSQWQPNEDLDLEYKPIAGEESAQKRSFTDRFKRLAIDARSKLQTAGAAAKAQSAVGISAFAKPLAALGIPTTPVAEKSLVEPSGPLYTDDVTETLVAQYGADNNMHWEKLTCRTGERYTYSGYTENVDVCHDLGPTKWFRQPKGPRPMPEQWSVATA